ncbi:hypothetical protein [Enterobacter sp.]|uniref:hypothetical protein n=1 Tax=Enterobacter sp. TaxID=42895 RepID=UPI0029814D13|nr:hypothetical protein [Enterobacter sp.]
MSNTHQIINVSVTLPALGAVSRDVYGNVIKQGAKCRVHLYAVHPEWLKQGPVFEGFMVGSIVFDGYTETPFARHQRVLMPDGYKLLALRIGEDEQPESWDSLPVSFTGGLVVDKGETFINDALIQPSAIEACNIQSNTDANGKQYAAAFDINVEGNKKVEFLADRFEVTVNAQNMSESALHQAINKAVTDAIRNAVKPGGLLYRGI